MIDPEAAAGGLLEIASLALALGQTPRITKHPDGAFETVATHTVMLAWCALSLNEAMELRLDPGEVARFALCHDAPETRAAKSAGVGRFTKWSGWTAFAQRGSAATRPKMTPRSWPIS